MRSKSRELWKRRWIPKLWRIWFRRAPASVPAYEAYLKGLAFVTRGNTTGDSGAGNEALTWFEEATRIDPKFSSAYAEQSLFWRGELAVNNIGTGDTGLQFGEIMSRYKQAIGQAIANERDVVRVALYKAGEATVDFVSPTRMPYSTITSLNVPMMPMYWKRI